MIARCTDKWHWKTYINSKTTLRNLHVTLIQTACGAENLKTQHTAVQNYKRLLIACFTSDLNKRLTHNNKASSQREVTMNNELFKKNL